MVVENNKKQLQGQFLKQRIQVFCQFPAIKMKCKMQIVESTQQPVQHRLPDTNKLSRQ